ncbi:MAG TPA: 50S ribosomal protein L19e [archaeon]|jgi:large subunit ribosomal protein L19e|nr:50S ribosomal protein L19e [archaeon]HPC10165.1 50S ribosomal protein L19e [archaeon]HRT02344.1 50S ribosomal protein L19e [Candidatus Diapherotrites archaeon]
MKLNKLKETAADILKTGKYNVKVNKDQYLKNKELVDKAITKEDVRAIIKAGVVSKKPISGQSRGRAKKLLKQKKLKRRRGPGKRKGKQNARIKDNVYNQKVRALRKKLNELKKENKLQDKNYHKLYMMIKGNYFKNKKHLEEYVNTPLTPNEEKL